MLITQNPSFIAPKFKQDASSVKLGKGVNSEALNLLDELQDSAIFASQQDDVTLETKPNGEIKNLNFKDVDAHSEEAVEVSVSTEGDLKTYSRSFSLDGMPGAVSSVTVNESTGTITQYSDDLQKTSNHHEDAYFQELYELGFEPYWER